MFKNKKYQVIRGALSKELSNFLFNYMLLQRDAVDHMVRQNQVNPSNPFMGNRTDKQCPGAYSKYADWAMETLLQYMRPLMAKVTGLELVPCYTYTRVYQQGSILNRHKDRPSCEISCTLNLGGDPWPIFIDPTGANTVVDERKNIIKQGAPKGVSVLLQPGDMLVYRGCDLEHWREPFQGTICSQVFLHYNNVQGPFAKTHVLDGRPLLGVPK